MRLKAASPLILVSVISGCAMAPAHGPASSEDPAFQMLQQSAQNIEQSLTQLSEAEQFEKMHINPTQPRIYSQIPGMEQVVAMPWHGTIEQAVTRLANYCGFTVKFMGKPPVSPIIVQIGVTPASVSDHLQNLGVQAGSRADIIVDPKQRLVEVRYAAGGV